MTGKARGRAELIEEALNATRERRNIEFKREFNQEEPGAWLELLKDLAAMANTGGGTIILGLEDDGSSSGWKPDKFLSVDFADIINRFAKYVGEQWDGFAISDAKKGRVRLAVILVDPREGAPIVFEKPGTYSDGESKQKTAFSRGTTYFRHGAKSEPGTARDLSRFVAREVQRQRRDWLGNVRKVAAAPKGAQIVVLRPDGRSTTAMTNVRVVDDPTAPAVARTDYDATHPFRQKEVINVFNDSVGSKVIGSYDVQCIRKMHSTDKTPEFFRKPKYGSPQYSQAFVDWMLQEYAQDQLFFTTAKQSVQDQRTASRGSP